MAIYSITSSWLIRIKLHCVCVQFCNEPTSIALNAAVETVGQKSDTQGATGEGIQESTYAFGIPDAVVTSFMHSAFLKGLKYGNGSYHQLVFLLYNICYDLSSGDPTMSCCFKFQLYVADQLPASPHYKAWEKNGAGG